MSSGPALLAAYLADKKISPADFAIAVRAHRSQIYRAMKGDRRPGADLRLAIEDETRGAVPARSWSEKVARNGRRPVPRRTAARAVNAE